MASTLIMLGYELSRKDEYEYSFKTDTRKMDGGGDIFI